MAAASAASPEVGAGISLPLYRIPVAQSTPRKDTDAPWA